MADEVIEYTCDKVAVPWVNDVLNTNTINGLNCTWNGVIMKDDLICFSWIFDWTELKAQGVESLYGQIIVHGEELPNGSLHIDVELKNTNQIIETVVGVDISAEKVYYASFELSLVPVSNKIYHETCDEMFAPSEENDGVLIVEDTKVNVNKAFLSYHSEYFRALFSANYKEGEMEEVPIKEISYKDFKLLLSTIHPFNVFPNDNTSEKLLELSDRFLMPSVTHKVNHHLLNHSRLENERLLWLADKYQLKDLLEKTIHQTNTFAKAKQLEQFTDYYELSEKTKAKLFDRVLKLI